MYNYYDYTFKKSNHKSPDGTLCQVLIAFVEYQYVDKAYEEKQFLQTNRRQS